MKRGEIPCRRLKLELSVAGLAALQKGIRRVLWLAFHVFHAQFKTTGACTLRPSPTCRAAWWSMCFNTSWMLRPELGWSQELGRLCFPALPPSLRLLGFFFCPERVELNLMTCQEWALSPFCYATAALETWDVPSPALWLSLAVEGFTPSVFPVRGVCV